jgi:6-methylsalicylic acid synthase
MATASVSNNPGSTAPEPIAIIGIGCRFPGDVTAPESFWRLLMEGRNTAAEVPEDRWDYYRELGPSFDSAVRTAIRNGNFLDRIEEFDAEFFRISPREASLMDPQQRLLLEVAWEALEHAGVPADTLAGTDAGVFVGVCTGDYGGRILEDLPTVEAWTGIGAATCAVANRLSHVLDLRGPSIAVDTACSASLVATHLACQALRLGESDIAFAGGSNLIVSPGQTLTLDASGALAPDGRSKPFDAAADGYGRGEGCGVLVLKRLADAQRDTDRILAVIRGSAVNQDGRTNGIMAPCGAAQEHVMHKALAYAGIDPLTVDYVEAHGTGTRLGDPMEVEALSAAYGARRPAEEPCLIGSVKANIGHLEGAAGVASMIKAVLALQQATVPATPLRTGLNPEIPWSESGLRVVDQAVSWPERGHPRRAGVSGFGYGGTVAHVLLEQAPPNAEDARPRETGQSGLRLFPVSANSRQALSEQAARLADRVAGLDSVADVGHTLSLRRAHLEHRAVVIAADPQSLAARLRLLADGQRDDGLAVGATVRTQGPGLVWVFSGHGSQWLGMGRELLTKAPFAEVMDRLEPIFAEEIGFTPRAVLLGDELEAVEAIQTMIFAMQVGLAEVWRLHGVTPSAVIGHSVGEIAAAVVAGALSLEDGARLICRRSVLLRRAAGHGAMAMAMLPFEEAERRLTGRDDLVAAIAASPGATVLSGDPAAIEELARQWPADGIAVRRVSSNVAFHSPHMDPLLPDLVAAADGLKPRKPEIPMYSTSVLDPRSMPAVDGKYWASNLRNPVRLVSAVSAALDDGYRAFLEISPHPVVAHSISETVAARDLDDVFVGVTLRRDRSEEMAFLNALGALHANGMALDWELLAPRGELVDLPTVAWQHRRHWHSGGGSRGAGRGHDVDSYTLLGSRQEIAGSAVRAWSTSLDDGNRPYPGSHTLNGAEIVPAAVLVETFRAAAGRAEPPALANVVMRHPLLTAQPRDVQVVLEGTEVRLASRSPLTGDGTDAEQPWLIHAHADVLAEDAAAALPAPMAEADVERLFRVDAGLIRSRLAQVGVPSTGFEWEVDELLYGDGRLRTRVQFAPDESTVPTWPAVLDAVMSIAPAVYPGDPVLRMVVQIDDVVCVGPAPRTAFVEVVLDGDRQDVAHAIVLTTDGTVVAGVGGLEYPAIEELLGGTGDVANDSTVDSGRWSRQHLAELSADELMEAVQTEVVSWIATEMGLPAEWLNVRKSLLEQGFDSVMTVAVRRKLESVFGIGLPPTVFWQQPTTASIAKHIAGLLSDEPGDDS